MKIGVMIQEGPYNHQASDTAYKFIEAAMARGNTIQGVFFYDDGVSNVSNHMEPPMDDRHIAKRWSELGAKGVDLIVCVAAAKRRGITPDLIVANSRISGLGQLSEICTEADRVVTFGD
jgi:tRNA 2-thiouridine synthesizing protein D